MAQRITQPQMIVGLLVAAQHVGACYLCIHHWGWGYLGAAAASVWSNLLSVSLLALVVVASGRAESVFGRPSKAAFQGWVEFAGLAYASAGAVRWVGQEGLCACRSRVVSSPPAPTALPTANALSSPLRLLLMQP